VSPFAVVLRELRISRGLRQEDLAVLAGCERTYLSALETDAKPAPSTAFTDSLCRALHLNPTEEEVLRQARAKSRRSYSIPSSAAEEAYEFVHELFARLDRLGPLEVRGLMTILELGDAARETFRPAIARIRRKDSRSLQGKENTMT
jgi:transcriptional regulator with XRE-family HTH domain